jgi:hypothetical protein
MEEQEERMDGTGYFQKSARTCISLTASILIVLSASLIPANASPQEEGAANKAARIEILASTFAKELAGQKAPSGKVFVVCETEWENIHPKQKVEKDKLEGKVDRTMGVGGFAGKKKTEKDTEYVDMDVAYQIKKVDDHAYLLADGMAFSLHPSTAKIPGGIGPQSPIGLPKFGDVKKVNLAYLLPEDAENLAFIFFDYQYGHIQIPIKGDMEKARGTGGPPGKIMGQAKTDLVEFAIHDLDILPDYDSNIAPQGWQYVVVKLSGKSLSGGNVRDIVQIKAEENAWISANGGYLYYCTESSTAVNGVIRFTPEFYQFQEIAFLVPAESANFRLGLRAKNEVLHMDLTAKEPLSFPAVLAAHKDGDVMEVLLFGMRKEQGKTIVDIGIRSLYDRGGLEIQTGQQFFLLVGEQEHKVDMTATEMLLRRPPQPFVVPPGESIRFELAFSGLDDPSFLRFRGYRSEGRLKF